MFVLVFVGILLAAYFKAEEPTPGNKEIRTWRVPENKEQNMPKVFCL